MNKEDTVGLSIYVYIIWYLTWMYVYYMYEWWSNASISITTLLYWYQYTTTHFFQVYVVSYLSWWLVPEWLSIISLWNDQDKSLKSIFAIVSTCRQVQLITITENTRKIWEFEKYYASSDTWRDDCWKQKPAIHQKFFDLSVTPKPDSTGYCKEIRIYCILRICTDLKIRRFRYHIYLLIFHE